MKEKDQLSFGLALSGSGNRSSFYVGFLEVLEEQKIRPDYIAASSGGALVAAAYACGSLQGLKRAFSEINRQKLKAYITKDKSSGGLYSLDKIEEEMRLLTKGMRFEDVQPLMGFITVDIESGKQVVLSMGDIAHAACASCTLPGIFEPVKWGGKFLVDGGLSSIIPTDVVKGAGMDVIVGINMRGTKHIFASRYLTIRSVFNRLKKIFFWDELEALFENSSEDEPFDFEYSPGIFTVLGKSLDIALQSSKEKKDVGADCDLLITPDIPLHDRSEMLAFNPYYELGRQAALEHLPKIKELIKLKSEIPVKVI